MDFTKGQTVTIVDCFGINHLRRIWNVAGDTIFVTSDRGFNDLIAGKTMPWPIGFDRENVYATPDTI